jgi:GPH family glycoside/pentoside/hexuronide:cation symporter
MASSIASVSTAGSLVATEECPAATPPVPVDQELMGKIKIATLTCLGSAISCASLVSSVYLIPFWTDVVGIGPRFMGIVIICAKVAEAISVVSAGIFSDNCSWRLGRRRPFLMACIPASVMYALLFNPPQVIMSQGRAASAWVFTFGLVFFAVWPYLTVCHSSWCAEFCRDYVERNFLYGFRYFWGTIGTITGAVLPLIVASAGGFAEKELHQRTKITNYVGFIVSCFIIALSFFVFAFVSEKARPTTDSSPRKALVSWFGQAFSAFRHSRVVRVHVLVSFLYDIALAYAVSFLPYMTSRVQKLQTSLVLGSYVVVSLVFIPLWLKISQYFEKYRVCSAACALQSGCLLAAGLVILFPASLVCVVTDIHFSGAEIHGILGAATLRSIFFCWSFSHDWVYACRCLRFRNRSSSQAP